MVDLAAALSLLLSDSIASNKQSTPSVRFFLCFFFLWLGHCLFACRELYIGNTSPDMTDMVLKDFLSNTMHKVWSMQHSLNL